MTQKNPRQVYLLQGDGPFYKIGSSRTPEQRARTFSFLPWNVRLVHLIQSNDANWLESSLHARFKDRHIIGEWFQLTNEDVSWLVRLVRFDRPLDASMLDASTFVLRLPEVYRDQLQKLRQRTRRPMTEEAKIALEKYLEQEGLWPPEKTHQ